MGTKGKILKMEFWEDRDGCMGYNGLKKDGMEGLDMGKLSTTN